MKPVKLKSMYFGNILGIISNGNWITKLISLFVVWFTPALELFLLLIGIVILDYLLDLINIYTKSGADHKIKGEIWEESKTFVKKVCYYSVLVLLMNALQIHLIKDAFELFRWVIAIPIIGESVGIVRTIENKLGVKIIEVIKIWLKRVFGKDDKLIDTIIDKEKEK